MTDTYRKLSTKEFLRALRQGWSTGHVPFLRIGVSTLLAASPGRITTMKELIEWIYGDDPEGGPDNAQSNITVTIHRLRESGVPIRTHGNRGYSYEREGT